MKNKLKKFLNEWSTFELIWLVVFTAINVFLFFAWHDTIIGLIASLTGMLCVVLTAKGRISSFYFGLINILTYSYVAFKSAYYGDVMLNMLYFLPMTFFGIYYWKRNQKQNENKSELIVKSLKWKDKLSWFILSIISIILYGFFLQYLGGTLPFVDSLTTVFSIVATILLTKRLTDQWFYWIFVNVFSIVMWAYIFLRDGNDITILVMWSAFLVNAVYGYYNWKKLEKKNASN